MKNMKFGIVTTVSCVMSCVAYHIWCIDIIGQSSFGSLFIYFDSHGSINK